MTFEIWLEFIYALAKKNSLKSPMNPLVVAFVLCIPILAFQVEFGWNMGIYEVEVVFLNY